MRTLAIFLALIGSVLSAAAEDAGSTMAALRDEKSECRYYLSMCKSVVGLDQAGQPGAALNQMKSLLDAKRVMVAKHDKEPVCVKQCDAELAKITKKKAD